MDAAAQAWWRAMVLIFVLALFLAPAGAAVVLQRFCVNWGMAAGFYEV